jgi:hypothetical protein
MFRRRPRTDQLKPHSLKPTDSMPARTVLRIQRAQTHADFIPEEPGPERLH